MQISRHWRMNSQRYRLQGVRYQNGEVSLQTRTCPPSKECTSSQQREQQPAAVPVYVVVGR